MEGGNGVKALVCPEPLASFLGDAGLGTFEVFEATPPKAMMTLGAIRRSSSSRMRWAQKAASSGVGVRLFLGRHLMTFVVRTWSRVILTDQSALSRSCPLGPIRGQP